ncbi:hypothetical protein AMECASPLE_012937 [Ameca splendens]|uniref:Uncharacterized protein n=1 Tax=Ameca splendens TaxID=208324 RepID=A0ABV0Y138_9TELE
MPLGRDLTLVHLPVHPSALYTPTKCSSSSTQSKGRNINSAATHTLCFEDPDSLPFQSEFQSCQIPLSK